MADRSPRRLVLIIDDEPIIRRLLRSSLQRGNFMVQEASDGEEGLELFQRISPDIVLLDLNMPEVPGLLFLQNAKELNPDIPIIVISGAGKRKDIAEALRLGAWDYLFKPIDNLDTLLHSIEKALENARLIQEKRSYQLHLERQVEQKALDLKKSEWRYRSLVSNIPVGIFRWQLGEAKKFITANQAMASILGYSTLAELLDSSPDSLFFCRGDWQNFLLELNEKKKIISTELLVKKQDSRELWVAISAFTGEGNDGRIIDGVVVDISKRKAAEEQVNQLSFFDALTNLPNRSMLLYHLHQAISSSRRKRSSGGIIFLGLDRFKLINDSMGHLVGDTLLQQFAQRLKGLIRDEDTLARVGGDEFAILLGDFTETIESTSRKLSTIAKKIVDALQQPFLVNGHNLYVSAGIGIALFPGKNDKAEETLRHASTAANTCKSTDELSFQFYLPEIQEAADQRIVLEKELREAVDNKELHLYYQPQVNNRFEIVGAEALLRWIHPKKGTIGPSTFIPLAEETGIILPIGEWVLRMVCQQMTEWDRLGFAQNTSHLSINVSPKQFKQPDFTDIVENTIRQNGADPHRLTIEITEGIVISDLEDTIKKMEKLRALGISFSIDDFGTGYSSLSYLNKLPLDQLKIDRSFTRGLTREANSEPIVSTIIVMAQNLGFDIVAEGVETEPEFTYLIENRCGSIQGYYFSKPLPLREFNDSLKKGRLFPCA